MICPYCGKEMVDGCIEGVGGGSLLWIDADENGDIERFTTKFTILEKAHFLRNPRLKCSKCPSCKKIIIDIEE